MFSVFELIWNRLNILEIRKKFFDPLKIIMHDIALWSVMFGKFLKVVILLFKYFHLVQNGRFSGQD